MSLPSASVLIGLLALVAGCGRSSNGQPSEKDCSAGCERAVNWKLAAHKKRRLWSVHEADENVDRVEDRAKGQTAMLKHSMASMPTLDEEKLKGLSPKERAAAISDFEFARKQDRLQDEMGIVHAQEAVDEAKRMYERTKQDLADWEKSTVEPAVSGCVATCMKRQLPYAQCLAKTQAVEDISVCEAM